MKKIRILSLCLCLALTASACGAASGGAGSQPSSSSQSQSQSSTPEGSDDASDSGRKAPEANTKIIFNSAASVEGEGAEANGGTVTITGAGVYSVSGSTTDGRIIVQASDHDVTLVLDGADILSPEGPAILFQEAGEALVWVAGGSSNTLEDGGSSEDYDGALYSCVSLTIDGSGSLEVTGTREEGIASEEHLTIDGGVIRVTAKDDGLNANHDGVSLITINGGELTVLAGGDGIDSNGSMEMSGGTVISMASLDDMSGGIDVDGDFVIGGGTLVATGVMNSLPSESSSQQSLSLTYKTVQAAGTQARILLDGEELMAVSPEKEYKTLLFSSPGVTDGAYDVWAGETQQTHKDAGTAGEFAAAGALTRFSSVTYLEDTDFVEDSMGGPRGERGPRPGGEGGTPPDGERPEPPKRPEDGSAPPDAVSGATPEGGEESAAL